LQARIHPHFLFNALNALYGAIPRSAGQARRAVLHLAEIFRYLLRAGEDLIPLGRELEIVGAYLEIEALRLGERLSWTVDVPPEALPTPIPMLSLQPLVENAVRHGVARVERPGDVRIAARIEGGVCRIEVSDTGPGLGDEARPQGVGLDNVRRRLALHFGPGARLELRRQGDRTVAAFAVPLTASAPAAAPGEKVQ
ncbi:MAG: sensor histidine kinase, partial [Bryobacteraceae bacterium]